MADFEKLGVFYLGRPYDLKQGRPKPGLLLYDSRDLVTHGVCVGMTGSGKTGLCVCLLEEAALDGIPVIAIDPKGDLTNLLLTFPRLAPEDFRPWVNEDDARTKGLSADDYAKAQAELWFKGLAEWGQDGGRIQRLREAAEFVVYTPGSNAGLPVSILKSFAAPPLAIRSDDELLAERVTTTANSLLSLLGLEVDPVQGREHILLSTILDAAWRAGQDLDLASLIQQIQRPPVSRIGVLDLEASYPAKERFELALRLNNLLAAPGFALWLEGEPLDIDRVLYTPSGKPRVAVFSIAHLGDAERMFFVSLLLNQVLGWMRMQSGTTSLRALLYMDEIFGFFPPVANPPSKPPLLTLLKQARAFGLGILLATQNPVDLDYKGLSNAGTWFLGRLQTERDKARVLEGLEGVAASSKGQFDRQATERTLAGLGKRIFLLHNVHEDAPEVFETRWAMSYLRGPLTRDQIRTLMAPQKAAAPPSPGAIRPEPFLPPTAAVPVRPNLQAVRPILPPDIPQHFLPVRTRLPSGRQLLYVPMLFGSARVQFWEEKRGVDVSRELAVVVPIESGPVLLNWDAAEEVDFLASDLEMEPSEAGASFAELPAAALKPKTYEAWSRDLVKWLYQTQRVELLRSSGTGLVSRPGESERDFRIRLLEATHVERDRMTARLRQKYTPRITALSERIRRAEQAVEREQDQAKQARMQTAVSVGATLLGAFVGRKAVSSGTVGRATTAARGMGRSAKEKQDIGRATENVKVLQMQLADLEAQFKAEVDALGGALDPLREPLDSIALKPKMTQISFNLVTLAWAPRGDVGGVHTPVWK